MRRILVILIFIMTGGAFMAAGDQNIKTPNVSGQFYTANPKRLSEEIDGFMQKAPVHPREKHIDIVVAPHAGYMYSGGVAAYGFKAASHNPYKTVIILAPSHYVGFDGISIWDEGAFQTPLGTVEVDAPMARQLIAGDEKFYYAPQAFAREHSLEVEIPFLQKTFQNFRIVPVIMGQPGYPLLEKFAAVLHETIGSRKDVLIVVSTDLSHYHDDAMARQMDQRTLGAIQGLKTEEIWNARRSGMMEMCGVVPVTAALLYAKEKGLSHVEVLRYANSGDVTGDKDRVVGYASIIISGNEAGEIQKKAQEEGQIPTLVVRDSAKQKASEGSLTSGQKKRLLKIARDTIYEYVQKGHVLDIEENDPRLLREEGAFVTIHKSGHLRGCIGNILGRGPLYLTVRDMAISSATKDPRFRPVTPQELDTIDVEVSVLSRPRLVQNADEIILGKHGVIISQGTSHQGLFLPQVATGTGWTKEEFLSQLCVQKAGLPPEAWKNPKTRIEIFTAEVFAEKDVEATAGSAEQSK
jgi:AmmeMemoRadiSam system protein B/AmmeMemoRadiSam system protein A